MDPGAGLDSLPSMSTLQLSPTGTSISASAGGCSSAPSSAAGPAAAEDWDPFSELLARPALAVAAPAAAAPAVADPFDGFSVLASTKGA